jgi:hypothetical protein
VGAAAPQATAAQAAAPQATAPQAAARQPAAPQATAPQAATPQATAAQAAAPQATAVMARAAATQAAAPQATSAQAAAPQAGNSTRSSARPTTRCDISISGIVDGFNSTVFLVGHAPGVDSVLGGLVMVFLFLLVFYFQYSLKIEGNFGGCCLHKCSWTRTAVSKLHSLISDPIHQINVLRRRRNWLLELLREATHLRAIWLGCTDKVRTLQSGLAYGERRGHERG